jgi:ferredoxin
LSDEFSERKIAGVTVRIDRGLCVASANCMLESPDLFEFDADNICVFGPDAGQVQRDTVIKACEMCPVEALTVLDENDKQQV